MRQRACAVRPTPPGPCSVTCSPLLEPHPHWPRGVTCPWGGAWAPGICTTRGICTARGSAPPCSGAALLWWVAALPPTRTEPQPPAPQPHFHARRGSALRAPSLEVRVPAPAVPGGSKVWGQLSSIVPSGEPQSAGQGGHAHPGVPPSGPLNGLLLVSSRRAGLGQPCGDRAPSCWTAAAEEGETPFRPSGASLIRSPGLTACLSSVRCQRRLFQRGETTEPAPRARGTGMVLV